MPDPIVLVTGAGGLVGGALAGGGAGVVGLTRDVLDVTDAEAIARALDRFRPAAVVNAAAQAKVDQAETEPDRTFAVNAVAPGLLARTCAARGIRLVHLSTDYVLAGRDEPGFLLDEDAPPDPRSAYARSKREGEVAALEAGATVVRLQWVYAARGPGFFGRALAAMSRGERVPLVIDQVGSPTPARALVGPLLACARGGPVGLFHLACSGEATPWEWVRRGALRAGIPFQGRPISRTEAGIAWRPARSCLDSRRFLREWGVAMPRWEEGVDGEVGLAGGGYQP